MRNKSDVDNVRGSDGHIGVGGGGGGGGVDAGSLRGSSGPAMGLRAGLRASRLRRASAAAAPGNHLAPGADLARRSPCARPGFDTLALLRRIPSTVSAVCEVRVGKGGLLEGLGFGGGKKAMGSESRWFEASLRGGVVVLSATSGMVRNGGGDEGEWKGTSNASLSDGVGSTGEAPILGLFSVVQAIVTRGRAGSAVSSGNSVRVERLSTGKEGVTLRFANQTVAAKWEAALRDASTARQAAISDFEFLAPIGKGASGKVFLVRDRVDGCRYALKVVPKSKVFETRSGYRHAMDERLALEVVAGFDFFTQLRYAFQTRSSLYFVMEFCEGGDLYQHLKAHGGRVGEGAVRAILSEVIVAMEHLHSRNFVYRDLKTENVLLSGDGHVRLADFGLSKYLPPSDPLTSTICGTHTFASVEMLAQRHYGKSPDLWALGVFAFYLLNGRTPFEAADLDRVIQKLNKRVIRFRSSTSAEFVSLVKRLLDWQPSTRLGCGPNGWNEVKEHVFFEGVDWNAVGSCSVHELAAETNGRSSSAAASSDVKALNGRSNGHANGNGMYTHLSRDVAAVKDDESPLSTPSKGVSKDVEGVNSSLPGSPVTPIPAANGAGESSSARQRSNRRAALSPETGSDTPADGDAENRVDLEDELRNFDVDLWRETVSIDSDIDDDNCERYLWPMRNAKRPLLDPLYVVGFNFSTSRL